MLLPGCRGFGKAVQTVDKIFQGVCGLIRSLSLQFLLTVGTVWLILYACIGKESVTPVFTTVFIVLMCIALAYALAATAYNVVHSVKNSGKSGKKKDKTELSLREIEESITGTRPNLYRVKQNPSYVMAEYPDRYELFYDGEKGLEYVKTLYKEGYGKKEEPEVGNDDGTEDIQ